MAGKAAFYDVDGTLVRTNVIHAYAYYAMNEGLGLGAWRGGLLRLGGPRAPLLGPDKTEPQALQRAIFTVNTRARPKTA